MASMFLRPLLRPTPVGLGLGLGLSIASLSAARHTIQRPLKMDSRMLSTDEKQAPKAKVPIVRNGELNPKAIKQISSGSLVGLCAGLAVSTFSKPLTLLIGLMVVGLQWASGHGINLLPYDRLQKYFKSINLRSTVQDNMAFKLSFGMTFAMAAFMHF